MRFVALALAIFTAGLGVIGMAAPSCLLAIARLFDTPLGLVVAAALRLALGAALFLGAARSRLPAVLRVIGAIIFVAGLATPFLGVERVRRILDWWSGLGPELQRTWAGAAFAIGVFLIWALSEPKHSAE